MIHSLTLFYNHYGVVVIGFIATLMVLIMLEVALNMPLIITTIVLVVLAIYLAKKTS